MIKAELQYLHSPDVYDLSTFTPPDPDNFCILVQAAIRTQNGKGENIFDFLVCTPQWLQNKLIKDNYTFGRHYLFLPAYDYELLQQVIVELCNRFSESDWQAVAEKIGRFGKWEFEDYRPSPEKIDVATTEKISNQNETPNKLESESVLANSELFTPKSYQEFMIYIKDIGEQLKQLRTASKKQQVKSPKSDEWRNIFAKYRQTSKLYRLRLHQHTVAVCPYCGESVIKPFDHFSLLGLYGHLNIDYTYVGNVGLKSKDVNLGRHCEHALFTMQFVNFNQHKLDDLPIWAANHLHLPSSYRLGSAPYVLVWPLIARRTSAVVHAVPIGRYDDLEPQHHYTSCFVTYFADGKNSNIGSFWNSGEDNTPTPALYGNIYKDYDLLKWVNAERLLWVDPGNTKSIVNKPIADFPYVNIQPRGTYRIKEDRSIDGLYPEDSEWIWSGTPPHHNQSFPCPIDI